MCGGCDADRELRDTKLRNRKYGESHYLDLGVKPFPIAAGHASDQERNEICESKDADECRGCGTSIHHPILWEIGVPFVRFTLFEFFLHTHFEILNSSFPFFSIALVTNKKFSIKKATMVVSAKL